MTSCHPYIGNVQLDYSIDFIFNIIKGYVDPLNILDLKCNSSLSYNLWLKSLLFCGIRSPIFCLVHCKCLIVLFEPHHIFIQLCTYISMSSHIILMYCSPHTCRKSFVITLVVVVTQVMLLLYKLAVFHSL